MTTLIADFQAELMRRERAEAERISNAWGTYHAILARSHEPLPTDARDLADAADTIGLPPGKVAGDVASREAVRRAEAQIAELEPVVARMRRELEGGREQLSAETSERGQMEANNRLIMLERELVTNEHALRVARDKIRHEHETRPRAFGAAVL